MSETPTESIFQPSTSFDSQNWLETLGILCMEVDVLNLCHRAVPNNADLSEQLDGAVSIADNSLHKEAKKSRRLLISWIPCMWEERWCMFQCPERPQITWYENKAHGPLFVCFLSNIHPFIWKHNYTSACIRLSWCCFERLPHNI